MSDKQKKTKPEEQPIQQKHLQKKIAALEKQLEWEKLRAEALDTMINIAEKDFNITIRKKPGCPTVQKIKKQHSYISLQKLCPTVGLFATGIS